MSEVVRTAAKKPDAKRENRVSPKKTEVSQFADSPVEQILFLQRTIGNRAVDRLVRSGALHAKLRISQPGDVYEQEADRVAEQVMRMPEPEVSKNMVVSGQKRDTSIQRRCPKCTDSLLKKEEEVLQPKEVPGLIPEVAPGLETDINAIRGGGQPLPESIRAFFEPRFGGDFGGVRVHADERAAEAARAVDARAFTVGEDMVFGKGEYAPGTSAGRLLVAHELTHVIQQGPSQHSYGNLQREPDDPQTQTKRGIKIEKLAEDTFKYTLVDSKEGNLAWMGHYSHVNHEKIIKEFQKSNLYDKKLSLAENIKVGFFIVVENGTFKKLGIRDRTEEVTPEAPTPKSPGQLNTQTQTKRGIKIEKLAEDTFKYTLVSGIVADMGSLSGIGYQKIIKEFQKSNLYDKKLSLAENIKTGFFILVKNGTFVQFGIGDRIEKVTIEAPAPTPEASAPTTSEPSDSVREYVQNVIDTVTRHVPEASGGIGDFIAAFEILNKLPPEDLMATLAELKRRGYIGLLMDNLWAAASFDQERLTKALEHFRSKSEEPKHFYLKLFEDEFVLSLGSNEAKLFPVSSRAMQGKMVYYDYRGKEVDNPIGATYWVNSLVEAKPFSRKIKVSDPTLFEPKLNMYIPNDIVTKRGFSQAETYTFDFNDDMKPDFSLKAEHKFDQFFRNYLITTFDNQTSEVYEIIFVQDDAWKHGYQGNFVPRKEEESFFEGFAKMTIDVAIGLIPVIGDLVDLAEAISGSTKWGEKMSTPARIVTALSVVIPYVGGSILRKIGGTEAAQEIAKLATQLGKSQDDVLAVVKAVEKSGSPHADQIARWRKTLEAGAELSNEEIRELTKILREIDLEAKVAKAIPVGRAAEFSPTIKKANETIQHAVCGFCFPAGTKILTKDGYKNIENIEVGDQVFSQNEYLKDNRAYKRVVKTFQDITDSLVEVTVGRQSIKSTPGHVWWVVGKGWSLAQDLKVGDELVTSNNDICKVADIRYLAQFAVTYNCEVEEYHTYFVASNEGEPGIWVHNNSIGVRVLRPDQVFQLIIPEIVITDREAIRGVIGRGLTATGSYSDELKGLYAFLRKGGGAGFQGVTADAIDRLEIVLRNIAEKGGGVAAAVDLERIGARRVFELSDPAILNRLMKTYPRFENFFGSLTKEGVVAVRGTIPARAVQSLVNIPGDLAVAEKRFLLEQLLKPCKK